MQVRGPKNVGRALGRAVQTDPKLLRYASVITEQKKCWELFAESLTGLKFCATKCNSVCKRTQHVTSKNVGSCSKILRKNQSDKSSLPILSLQILFMYFSVWNMKVFSLFKNHLQWALLILLVCLLRKRLYWTEFCWSLQKCNTFTPKATVNVGYRKETCKASFLLGNVLISIW